MKYFRVHALVLSILMGLVLIMFSACEFIDLRTVYSGPVTSDNFKSLASTLHGIDILSVNDKVTCVFGADQGTNYATGAKVKASCRGDTEFSWAFDGYCTPSIDYAGTTMSWLVPDVQFSVSTAWTLNTINYQTGSSSSTAITLPVAVLDQGGNVSLLYTDAGLQLFEKDLSTGNCWISTNAGTYWTQFANTSDGYTYTFLADGVTVIRSSASKLEISIDSRTTWTSILPTDSPALHLFQAAWRGSSGALSFFDDSGDLRISTDKGTTWTTLQLKTSIPDSYAISPDGQKLMVLYVTPAVDTIPDHCDIYTSQDQGLSFKHYYSDNAYNAEYWHARSSQDGQHFYLTSRYDVSELVSF